MEVVRSSKALPAVAPLWFMATAVRTGCRNETEIAVFAYKGMLHYRWYGNWVYLLEEIYCIGEA